MSDFQFDCVTCGQPHVGIPAFGFDAPHAYLALPEGERAARAELGTDQCVIDGKVFFVRGCLDLPIQGHAEPLRWGVWVSVSEKSFDRLSQLWKAEGRESEPPMSGWLDTSLPGYPPTLQLKTSLRLQPRGARPQVEVEPTEHPLAVDQREGVGAKRLQLLIQRALHGGLHGACERVRETFEANWGEADNIIVFDALLHGREAFPPVPRLDVFVWRANEEVDVTSFVTCGMAAQPMPGGERRAELHFGIRAKLSAEQEHAVARFLANLSCYPWSDGRAALGFWHTLAAGIPIPCFPGCSSLLLRRAMADDGIDEVETEYGTVLVPLVVPITAAEHACVRTKGIDALLQQFEHEEVDLFVGR